MTETEMGGNRLGPAVKCKNKAKKDYSYQAPNEYHLRFDLGRVRHLFGERASGS